MYIIHSNTILSSIHFSKSFTTISYFPPDVNPISNLAKNYISKTYHPTRLYTSTRIIFLKSSHIYPHCLLFLRVIHTLIAGFLCARIYPPDWGFNMCARVHLFKKLAHFLCVRLELGLKYTLHTGLVGLIYQNITIIY